MTHSSHTQPAAGGRHSGDARARSAASRAGRRPERAGSAGFGRRLLLALLGALSLAVAPLACSRGAKKPAEAVEPVEPVTVEVQNRHGTDMVIYAIRGNTRTRLGSVTTGSTQSFTLPLVYVGDLGGFSLFGDPVGEPQGIQSERLVVQSGQRVVWTLEARLSQSSIGVY